MNLLKSHSSLVFTPEYVQERLVHGATVWDAFGDKDLYYLRSGQRTSLPGPIKEAAKMDRKISLLDEAGLGKPPPKRPFDITAIEIDMAFEVLPWTLIAEPEERKVIALAIRMLMVGENPKWKMIRWLLKWNKPAPGKKKPVSVQTVTNRYKRGIMRISDALNEENLKIKPQGEENKD